MQDSISHKIPKIFQILIVIFIWILSQSCTERRKFEPVIYECYPYASYENKNSELEWIRSQGNPETEAAFYFKGKVVVCRSDGKFVNQYGDKKATFYAKELSEVKSVVFIKVTRREVGRYRGGLHISKTKAFQTEYEVCVVEVDTKVTHNARIVGEPPSEIRYQTGSRPSSVNGDSDADKKLVMWISRFVKY